ncbi:MAG: DUF1045 domain-containing protein [Paracoccus sp. (in: a-proteobacteria)]
MYYTPSAGAFADFGASWLGWDLVRGCTVTQPIIPGLDMAGLTSVPRRYGFHATLKAPFRLARGASVEGLCNAVEQLAGCLPVQMLPGLQLEQGGGCLALTVDGDASRLNALAVEIVTSLDDWRAPLAQAEIARRNPDRLTLRQMQMLKCWGYPYVLDEFRFHMTLSGPVKAEKTGMVCAALQAQFGSVPCPGSIDAISLVGEGEDRHFRLIERFRLQPV